MLGTWNSGSVPEDLFFLSMNSKTRCIKGWAPTRALISIMSSSPCLGPLYTYCFAEMGQCQRPSFDAEHWGGSFEHRLVSLANSMLTACTHIGVAEVKVSVAGNALVGEWTFQVGNAFINYRNSVIYMVHSSALWLDLMVSVWSWIAHR